MKRGVDVLMITYNRPQYTRLSLKRLLETADDDTRIWVWHNGTDEETLEIVQSHLGHPRFHQFHHSHENAKLTEPTNWLWRESEGVLLGKVDDDCLVPPNWIETLVSAHESNPALGVVGCWHFQNDDFEMELARPKIRQIAGEHQILLNCWVGGSGYLMKRACVDKMGLLRDGLNFTKYCTQLAARGWMNGWYYPFILQDHMDDPRSPNTLFLSDEDFRRYRPLSAARSGAETIEDWQSQLRESARAVQAAPFDPLYYVGWRSKARGLVGRLRKILVR